MLCLSCIFCRCVLAAQFSMSCRHDHRINRGKGCKIVFRQQVTKLGYLPSFSQFFQTFASENLVKPAVALSGAHCCVNALSLKDSSVATRRRVNLGLPRSGESAGLVCLCAFGRSEYAPVQRDGACNSGVKAREKSAE